MIIQRRHAVLMTALFSCAFALLTGNNEARADRYDAFTLGDSPVSYVEHRNSVNDSTRVAWTELFQTPSPQAPNPNPKHPRARLTNASNTSVSGFPASRTQDLHAELTHPQYGSLTYAGDFMSRAEDLNNSSDVVGYATDTAQETRRHAALWLSVPQFVTVNTWKTRVEVVDLHVAAETKMSAAYAMTAAYGVSDRIDDYVFVVGYARNSLNTGSIPIVWQVNWRTKSVIDVYELNVPNQAGRDYGILYDVAVKYTGGSIEVAIVGGVGGQRSGQAYIRAYGAKALVGGNGRLGAFASRYAPEVTGSAYATSTANRVEVLDNVFYATGFALRTNGQAEAFIWRDYLFVETGAALNGGNVAIGMGLGERTDSAATAGYLQVLGASTFNPGPVGSNDANGQSSLRAFHAYYGVSPNLSPTCDLNAEMPTVADSMEIATDMNSGGAVIGWSGTRASLLVPIAKEAAVITRYVRTPSNVGADDYWWIEAPRSDFAAGQNGEIIFSDAIGCSVASGCGAGTLELDDSNADIYSFAGVRTVAVGQYSAYTDKQTGAVPTPRAYVQYSIANPAETGDFACDVSEAIEVSAVTEVVNSCTATRPEPAVSSFSGDWRDCIGGTGDNEACETDVRTSYDHCGACGASANDGLSCTTNSCVAGAPSFVVNNNRCLIDGGCFSNGDKPVLASGANGAEAAVNQCEACASTLNNTSYSPIVGATCCNDGDPLVDAWENQSGGSVNYRPARPNASYLANSSQSENWMRRIRQVDDGDIWMDFRNGNGDVCWNFGDSTPISGLEGPRRLTSSLNGTSDQEDWYVFRHEDKNGTGSRIQEPRARARGLAGQQIELCMYWLCPEGASKDYNYESKEGLGITKISRGNSPIGTANGGLRGLCQTSAAGGATDMELYFESGGGCNGSGAWNPDIFLQVKAVNPAAVDCNDSYELYWGNDIAARSAGSYQTSTRTPSICDGQGVPVTP